MTKTPDKIYVGIEDMGSGYVYALSLEDNGHQEYIRKEALVEWLNNEIKNLSDGNLYGYYVSLAYQDMIDKLNSL